MALKSASMFTLNFMTHSCLPKNFEIKVSYQKKRKLGSTL
jgi:hypothetical protein